MRVHITDNMIPSALTCDATAEPENTCLCGGCANRRKHQAIRGVDAITPIRGVDGATASRRKFEDMQRLPRATNKQIHDALRLGQIPPGF